MEAKVTTSNKRRFDIYPFILLLLGGLMRIICYLQNFKFRFRLDDFGPVVYPAYLAGYDWSSYVRGNEHYYGFGYYWIMAPLFKWISSPRKLLMGIAAVNSLTIILTGLLIYHLLVTYFDMKRGWGTVFLALVPTMLYGSIHERRSFWLHTDNEVPMLLAIWLTVWAILAAERAMKKGLASRCLHAFITAAALTWALSVHERAMAMVIAVAFVELLLFLMKRKWLLQPVAFYGALGAGYFAQRAARRLVIGVMWQGGWPSVNTSAFKDVGLWFLQSRTAIKAMLLIFFGNIHSIIIKGFGVTAIAIVLLVVWLVRNILPKLNAKQEKEDREWLRPEMLVILIFGACIAITLAGLCVRWGLKLLPGMNDYSVSKGYKGICYGRYYQSYMSPVVLATMVLLCRRKKTPSDRSLAEGWWALFSGAEIIFYAFIFYKLLKVKEVAGSNFYNMAHGLYLFKGHTNAFYVFVTIATTAIVIALLSVAALRGDRILLKGRKLIVTGRHFVIAAAVFILVLFGVDRLNQFETFHPTVKFFATERMAKALTDLEEKELLPENMYMPQNNWCFGLQFMKKELTFLTGTPSQEQMEEDNLVITTAKRDVYAEAGYTQFKVGNHWLYTNNEEAARDLTEYFAAEKK